MPDFAEFFRTISNTLFPDACVGCAEKGTLLCGRCAASILPAGFSEESFITSVYSYRDARIKRLIWLLKYKNGKRVANIFAPKLAEALTEFLGEEGRFLGREIVLVPIPLSQKRRRMRGYNQAELLARAIMRHVPPGTCRLETELLKKHAETLPQAHVRKRDLRLKNLGDCFSVHKTALAKGTAIILIDDVSTTGATLATARKTLRKAGYRNVRALTVAH